MNVRRKIFVKRAAVNGGAPGRGEGEWLADQCALRDEEQRMAMLARLDGI
jgi:hypothetical protein